MPNVAALSLMVSDKKIFKDFKKNYVLLLWQPEFLSLMVSDKNIFEDFKKFYVLLPWQPEFLKESNSFKKF